MLKNWPAAKVIDALEQFKDHYTDVRDAHQKAQENLTDISTIKDMRREVNKIMPDVYKEKTNSENFLNPRTGEVKTGQYVKSIDFYKDISSFINSSLGLGTPHEKSHQRDLGKLPANSPLKISGLFWAQSEVTAYSLNITIINAALKRAESR